LLGVKLSIDKGSEDGFKDGCIDNGNEDGLLLGVKIEHLIKLFKQHCSALDANYKFIADA
jgi:hypothetical protein